MKVKRFAELANLSELKAVCETFIVECFEDLSKEEQFCTDLKPSEMEHYLLLDEQGVWNEDTVLRMIEKWASMRGPSGPGEAVELARHLRVDRLSDDCVKNAVNSSSLTKTFLVGR